MIPLLVSNNLVSANLNIWYTKLVWNELMQLDVIKSSDNSTDNEN